MKRTGAYSKGNIFIYIERSKTEVCIVNKLTINGFQVDVDELGYLKDIEPGKAAVNGCGNRVFIPNDNFFRTKAYQEEMNLNDEDYDVLKELLVDILSIGYCKKCR